MKTIKHKKKTPTRKKIIRGVLGFAVVIVVIAFISFAFFNNQEKTDNNDTIQKVQGYNFNDLKKSYPDVVAWLNVPNTAIDLPVVQHPTNDYYYLKHDAKKDNDPAGAAYIELANNKNMTSPVTVIYGHNMLNDQVFSTAHKFADNQFFNNNEKFYIYIPGHKLTYTIVSVFLRDDSHILNTHQKFEDEQVLKQYQNEILHPTSSIKNVRSGIELDEHSHIVQLSTCMNEPELLENRFIVTGVETNNEPTY